MAHVYCYIFRALLGTELRIDTVEFWFTMQITLICGFLTSYPLNGRLI